MITANESDIKQAFDLFDTEKKGKVNLEDTVELMKMMEYDKENPAIFEIVNAMGDREVDYEDFKERFLRVLQEENMKNGIRRIYNVLLDDPDKDDIDISTLRKACSDLGETFSDLDYQYILDNAGDGQYMTFEQFEKFMTKKYI